MWLVSANDMTTRPERRADLLHDRRRGNRVSQVLGHERRHLPTNLKIRHVAIEINPVQTLDIQGHVTIQKLIHRQRCSHATRMTPTRHAKPAHTSAVRGAASLGDSDSPIDEVKQDRPQAAFRNAASKVPEVTVAFWITKALTTG